MDGEEHDEHLLDGEEEEEEGEGVDQVNKTDLQDWFKANLACLFVSDTCLNGCTNQVQILCGTSRGHWEGLWSIRLKICNLKIFRS